MILEQFIAKSKRVSVRSARLMILSGDVSVDELPLKALKHTVSRFDRIRFQNTLLQSGGIRRYLMFHKPVGVLSATKDNQHSTVIDYIDLAESGDLHLAGRLDRSSSGLILLTNDGNWSEGLTLPDKKVGKEYIIETDRDIPERAIDAFFQGFYFEPEGILTKSAHLEIIQPRKAKVTLYEGRYHQIKRMFHRIDGIRLTSLHRSKIGSIELPSDLKSGGWRHLSSEQVASVIPKGNKVAEELLK